MPETKKHRTERATVINFSRRLSENLKNFEELIIKPDEFSEKDMVTLMSYYEQLQSQMSQFQSAVTRLAINVMGKHESR